MKVKLSIFDILIYLSSSISFSLSLFNFDNFDNGYRGMTFFPLLFLIIYIFIFQKLRHTKYPFTVYGLIIMQWIRFVLMPPVISLAGNRAGFHYINPNPASIQSAILLMIYELLFTSIFLFFWFKLNNKKGSIKFENKRISLKGNKIIYLLFILVVLVVVLSIGKTNHLINFIYIPVTSSNRIGDVVDTSLVLARQVIIIGLFLIFLWTLSYCKKKYEKNRRKIYVDFAIVMALLNVSFIVGERRTAQIYTATVCIWILYRTFPLHKKRIFISIGSLAIFVLSLMSIYKFFGAFQYDSYLSAVSNSTIDMPWFSRTLQSYFFGPENIAAVIEFSNLSNLNFGNLFFDLLRSIFGISFFMKGQGTLTSELFNSYIYGVTTPNGHVISAVGYGYIFFGIIFSPIVTIINIILCSKIENMMYKSKSYEMAYLWGYVLVRFATNLFVNPAPLISYSTMTIGTAGLLFIIAIILRFKNEKQKSHVVIG